MTTPKSRLPGFRTLSIDERRETVAHAAGIDPAEIAKALDAGGLSADAADHIVENVIGTYALPFGIALNFRVNGKEHLVPMVVEEPSVIAAASNAAKMVLQGGGFQARVDPSVMTCQVQIYDVDDVQQGTSRILANKNDLMRLADCAVPDLVALGGGTRDVEVRQIQSRMLVVHLYVDCLDAMGANMVNTIAEAVSDPIAALAGGKRGLRILSNLSDHRCVNVSCVVPAHALATDDIAGTDVITGIVNASHFAEADPYRAATHNKGIMNGLDAVCLATGNDWRAAEAGAHAFAARTGRYSPLSVWEPIVLSDGSAALRGSMTMPLAIGIVGGTLRAHPAARLAVRLVGATTAGELAMVAASAGLANNLAALRALATHGIQKGHMSLHARAVAVAAGAEPDEADRVAAIIVEEQDITPAAAARAIDRIRSGVAGAR
jgi:hydroxymethylglutaryl-CoA reductase